MVQTYNPITHAGRAPADAPAKGVKIAASTLTHNPNLCGSGCLPRSSHATPRRQGASPGACGTARVDHLLGERCSPVTGAAEWLARTGPTTKVDLRASVDHLQGEACAVREIHGLKATIHDDPPILTRGMVTKLVRDRMVAAEAHDRMRGSSFYQPGQGYTHMQH